MTTAREIMTPDCQCVRSSDSVVEAARRLADLDVGALPICGEDERLKGMLTDRDIVVKVVAQRKDPLGMKAGDLAEGLPVTVDADADVSTVLRLMSEHQVRRVPVLENRRLVGIIAQADIARALRNRESGEVVEAISEE
ncbi:CBS domain-containing protein [Nocardia sp. ET3-3]|uniref:CBS domain-containing protein n=1 Tax=Nocardia terrae TaxID=2675851 RepID=A0A7K1USI3_9NOCA|nr:CBS domain-containing protein [Nocardia terrae]MVU77306.1 CBS domain-containing protein [Nocardia terrae]